MNNDNYMKSLKLQVILLLLCLILHKLLFFVAVAVLSHPKIIFLLIFIFKIVDIVFNVAFHIIATKKQKATNRNKKQQKEITDTTVF